MAFAIMRAKKLNSMGTVAAALQHCYRDRETPNADQERTPDNDHLAARSTDEAMGKLRERLPEKRRKDAVLAVEYVMSASPEWWQTASADQQREFFKRSTERLADKYGAENVVTATIHRDELTPHLSAFVVPRTADGRLSAKEFIGNRTKMSQDQTSYAERVADLGLERGIEGSRATHQRVKTHYGAIQQAGRDVPHLTPDELKPQKVKGVSLAEKVFGAVETVEGVAQRLNAKIMGSVQPMAEKAAVSAQNERRAKELRETLAQQQKRLQALQEPFKGLSKDQVAGLIRQAVKLRQENEQEKQERAQQIKERFKAKRERERSDRSRGR